MIRITGAMYQLIYDEKIRVRLNEKKIKVEAADKSTKYKNGDQPSKQMKNQDNYKFNKVLKKKIK